MPIPVETCDYAVWDGYVEWDTCPADAGEFNRGEYVRTDDADRAYEAVLTRAEQAEQERDTLRAALEQEIACPACGETVKDVASATFGLALWQHWNWTCGARKALEADRDSWRRVADTRESENLTLRRVLAELYTMVRGECPSLLNEDSGGDAALDLRIGAALASSGADKEQTQ